MRFLLMSMGLSLLIPASAFATPIEGTDFSGKPVKLEAKQVVVVFMSSKCPCSNSHSEEIRKLATEFPKFRFLAVNSNVDENFETSRLYFAALNYPFPVLRDETQKLVARFKAVRTPHAFVMSESGEIVFAGGVSDSSELSRAKRKYLREALTEISAGKKVSTPSARPLGCAIGRVET